MGRKKYNKNNMKNFSSIILAIIILVAGYFGFDIYYEESLITQEEPIRFNKINSFNIDDVPCFDGSTPYVFINDNEPDFEEGDFKRESFENYENLDSLGRCGVAFANISKDIMPTKKREEIGSVKPTGWHTVKYDIIEGKYLYNRCHLIAYQLTAENANEKNLITGTKYFNVKGMLPFENQVADYIKKTNNHVLYRVTPIFIGNNLVASGVQIEAESVEDKGENIKFNVYIYNNQPGISINYLNGNSELI